MSDPAPLPLQNLLGHWFLSRSLPQIFVWGHLRPSDVVDAPQTCVDNCLNLPQHCLCLPPSFASIQQNRLHVGAENAKFVSRADLFGGPDVLEHDKGCSCFADPGCDISVRVSPPPPPPSLSVNGNSTVEERIHLPDGLSRDCNWCVGSGVDLHQLSFLPADLKPCPSRYGLQAGGLVLHLAVAV